MNHRAPAMCAAAAWVLSAAAAAADRTLEHQGVVEAPLAEVWAAFTTSDGFASWAVAHAQVDLRLGGEIRSSYHPQSDLHDEHTIVNRIISYEPQRMLSIRNEQAPAGFKNAALFQQTWSVIYFEPLGRDRTHVRVIGLGYGEGPEWDEIYDKFKAGNAVTLERLQQKFAGQADVKPGAPSPDESTRVQALLRQMVGGDWIHETVRDDGSVFRARSRLELGPDGTSLVGYGWLGDAEGMFYHGATQIWFEPPAGLNAAPGGVRFQNINESGHIARGKVTLHESSTLNWDWNAVDPDGRVHRYRVFTTVEDADHYRFVLHRVGLDGAEPRELVSIQYQRVHQLPDRFEPLKSE